MGIIDILSAPPGGLVYHLITLFAIQAVLGMAMDEWQRHEQFEYRRLVFAFGTIFLSRLILMGMAFIAWQGWLPPAGIIPPLERFLDLVSTILILYAFLPRHGGAGGLSRSLCFINLALALIVYGVFAPLWYSALSQAPLLHYNGYWQEWVWEIWQIAALIWAMFATARQIVVQRTLLLSVFGILFLGHVLHTLLQQGPPHIAGWERIANLIAYSVVVAVLYRAIVEGLGIQTVQLQVARHNAMVQLREAQNLFEVAQRICASLDLAVVLQRASQGALKVLGGDSCAVILRCSESPEKVEVAAASRADGTYKAAQGVFDLSSIPAIHHVLERGKRIILEADSDTSAGWQVFLQAIGSSQDQTLTMEPLLAEEAPLGVLIMGEPSIRQPLPRRQRHDIRGLASLIAAAIHNALLYRNIAIHSPGQDNGAQGARPRPSAGRSEGEPSPKETQHEAPTEGIPPETDSVEPFPVQLPNAQAHLDENRLVERTPPEPNPSEPLHVRISRAQQQLEETQKGVTEVEGKVRSLRAEMAEHNRLLAQLSCVLYAQRQSIDSIRQ